MTTHLATSRSFLLRRLSPTAHGALDHALIGALALAPALFSPDTPPAAAIACYGLVAAHYLLVLCTRYSWGLLGAIAFPIHGALEVLLAPLLVALPWLLGFADRPIARDVFILAGLAALSLALTTDYDAERDRDAPNEPPVDRGAGPRHRGP